MFGQIALSRRQAIKVVASGTGLAALQSQRAGAEQKLAKLDARYQEHPNGAQHCALCEYYIAPVNWCAERSAQTVGAASSIPLLASAENSTDVVDGRPAPAMTRYARPLRQLEHFASSP